MPKRRPRDTQIPKKTYLHPIDITAFGDPETDPCYGKHYSLTHDECTNCGDHEVCAIAFGQLTQKRRILEEKKSGTKDLTISNLELAADVKSFYESKLRITKKKIRSIHLTAKRFKINIKRVKELIK